MVKIWGVDSAENVDKPFFDCVLDNFGKPSFWGRYLTTVEGASEGLTLREIQFLHGYGIKILPIYNNFKRAVGIIDGRMVAINAIFHARQLRIPKDKIIFANIEKSFEVDESWIRGWVEIFYQSDYKQGIYHDPVNGDFSKAYCEAVNKNDQVALQTVLWSREREVGTTKKQEAPKFNPQKVPCKENTWAWQYGRDSKICPIDTNLILDNRLLNLLY